MTDREVQIRLGIFFAAINITAVFLGGLAGIYINILAGLAVFFATVIISAFLVEKKAWSKLEETENNQEERPKSNTLFNI